MITKAKSRKPAVKFLLPLSLMLLLAVASFAPAQSSSTNTRLQLPAIQKPVRRTLSIFLQPLGSFPSEDLKSIEEGLKRYFNTTVTILPSIPLPEKGYQTAQGRYRASDLLDYLGDRCPKGSKIIGLTAADISIKKGNKNDWGVFGLGDLSGPAAIVSSYRIHVRPELRRQHLLTVARHELGHTLGLKHCSNKNCLMAAGDGLDITPAEFCPICIRVPAPFLRSN